MLKAPFISILLIVMAVLCPLQCYFLESSSVGSNEIAGCCDCELPNQDSSNPLPTAPDDCECRDCFCRGALPVEKAAADTIATELVSFKTSWVNLDLRQSELPKGQVHRNSNVLSIHASAREVRAALCCWLI